MESVKKNSRFPAPGVCRSPATDADAGLPLNTGRYNSDADFNRRRRGVASKDSRSREALLRCGSFLQMGAFNENTLRIEYEVVECQQWRNNVNIEILGVQEHRINLKDPKNIEHRTIGSSTSIISSGSKNEAQA
ncbi:AP1 endonuclease [Elysia marginata]|uniref:AP1 endonuclease n=1 Tax=Elysia marginata TaxID=1093978 RepID=A0AAV4HVV9_9GAST|nr:AP1 endonuclease [Elysia marginata]